MVVYYGNLETFFFFFLSHLSFIFVYNIIYFIFNLNDQFKSYLLFLYTFKIIIYLTIVNYKFENKMVKILNEILRALFELKLTC